MSLSLLNIISILFSLGLFLLLIYLLVVNCDTVKEPWVNYERQGNIYTGAGNLGITPLAFYEYPVYRKPYNYPVCHLVDYPTPHCRTDNL